MEKPEQARIVADMLEALRADMEATLQHVPEHWNGIQLRLMLVSKAAEFLPPWASMEVKTDRERRREMQAYRTDRYNMPRG